MKTRPTHPGMLASLLAGLAMLGPFSIDTYLPAFVQIRTSLHTDELAVQQTLTAFVFSFGLMMLWHGALSDAFGRRRVILVGMLIFLLATIGCIFATSIEQLWFFRILQGLSSGAGAVLGPAIIHDLYQDREATRLLALVGMLFAIGPGIAPIIGGWIIQWFDWRAIFVFILFYSTVLSLLCYWFLPESLPVGERKAFHPMVLLHSYRKILSSWPYLLKAGTLAFNFAGLFLYVAAAPVFVINHLHLTPQHFAWQFIPMVAGLFLGSGLSTRLGKTRVARHQISLGFACMLSAGGFNLAYHWAFPALLPWSILPVFLYAFGLSLVAPIVMLKLMDLIPELRGTAASCQAFSQTMLSAVAAGVVAPLVSGQMVHLAGAQLAFGMLGLLCWLIACYHRKPT